MIFSMDILYWLIESRTTGHWVATKRVRQYLRVIQEALITIGAVTSRGKRTKGNLTRLSENICDCAVNTAIRSPQGAV